MSSLVPDDLDIASPALTYKKVSAATTNADTIKASPGVVVGYYICNSNAAFRYVKLYNKASNPTVGTDVPVRTFGLPGESAANISLRNPLRFTLGIAIAMTTGAADTDVAAVALNEIVANIDYV